MSVFHYSDQNLYIEDVPIRQIAEHVGTPVYIYSAQRILTNFQRFDQAFHDLPHTICYAIKANSNLSILSLLAKAGCGAEIVSGGELYRARKAGIPSEKISYSGVGKTEQEIVEALQAGVRRLHIESIQEFELICKIARDLNLPVQLAPRVNPDIDAQTHPYISTGLRKNKFGLNMEEAKALFRRSRECSQIQMTGISMHIGSQITQLGPFIEATKLLVACIRELRQEGFQIDAVNLGGGLGIPYNQETVPTPEEYGKAVLPILQELECHLVLEPGRAIVADAGILVMKVLYTKQNVSKHFTIVDAAMTECIRPALYQAYHAVLPVYQDPSRPTLISDIVGPVCESSDFFAKKRELPQPQQGDLLALLTAGAYGFAMASHYNSRPNVAEVLVEQKNFRVIRQRETYADLIRSEEV